jgi:serine/threonine-protein kinase
MGEIWLARDLRIERDIAIKLMRGDGHHDADSVARFLREARVQGRLEHPSVVPVHDLGGDDRTPFFAMKRLTGTTLADVLSAQARGERDAIERWSRRTLLARLVDVCLAIELAHRRGVIHRDLKPANIMLGDFGEAYVLDWGLARIADVVDSGAIQTADLRGDSGAGGNTVAGALLGTPGYMSPEQMRGEPIDPRADVFALGCILFEILTGSEAIPRDNTFEATLSTPNHRPSLRRPTADIPPELDHACVRATAAELAARTPSARELADDIQRFLDGDRDLARRRELAAEHAARAAAALMTGSDDTRADAMREAGRALALDPQNPDAQHILATLLLRPPSAMPAEAQRRIDEERQERGRIMLKNGAATYAGFLALVPIAWLLGAADGPVWPYAIVAGLLAALMATTWLVSRRPGPISAAAFAITIGLHTAMIGSVGILLGPLLLVPIILGGSMAIFLLMPSVDFPKRCLALHLIALAVPLGLEWGGIVPASFYVDGGALVLKPWAIHVSASSLIFMVLATVVVQLVANTVLMVNERRTRERAQDSVHLHAWHLSKLLPDQRSS